MSHRLINKKKSMIKNNKSINDTYDKISVEYDTNNRGLSPIKKLNDTTASNI